MLALLFVYQVSLDCLAVWCSEREVLALEHKLDIFVLRRKQIINLIEKVFRTRYSTFGRKLEPQNKAGSSGFVDSERSTGYAVAFVR